MPTLDDSKGPRKVLQSLDSPLREAKRVKTLSIKLPGFLELTYRRPSRLEIPRDSLNESQMLGSTSQEVRHIKTV